ncbi:hypothetical protein F0562_025333 [Nyssa sinensis]|uniref:Retrovirus-related Pol polyprotein from transposon TNT 1-94-like beta-barrel domain-containing protein n=1 Tax=Nyssa sinensis TaxID=561372 RepID=A0A5J5BFB6_9ASTE|nr:hypothetical protein F0562_025333 [Nyssa sinensis]
MVVVQDEEEAVVPEVTELSRTIRQKEEEKANEAVTTIAKIMTKGMYSAILVIIMATIPMSVEATTEVGANNHMCGRKELFVDLNETIQGQVSFSNSSKTLVKAKGNIMIKNKSGDYDFISNVYYV